ncbi:hypothetical protein FRC11_013041 [Ceratobasidium sp. 423]|nr:hypothetical protein FRC11_013041 [Ceratobasidium sp. 423]
MTIPIIYGMTRYAAPGDTNGNSTDDLDQIKHEVEPEDWREYSDYEVWVAVRKMLGDLPQKSLKKVSAEGNENPAGNPWALAAKGRELRGVESGIWDVNSYEPSTKGSKQGFMLEAPLADLLLKKRGRSIVIPEKQK